MATFNYSEGSYWCSSGKHQEKFDSLFATYVPKQGEAHESVELLRLINRVCYDVYNNGGGNLIDMGTSAYARYLVELAPQQGVSMGYVGEKLEKVWERAEEIQDSYNSYHECECCDCDEDDDEDEDCECECYCYCGGDDEQLNEHAIFDEDNKFLQELELLMDTIVLHCEARIKEADKTFWKTYGGLL